MRTCALEPLPLSTLTFTDARRGERVLPRNDVRPDTNSYARLANIAGDLFEVGLPCAAAPTPDIEVRVPPGEFSHERTKRHRVTGLEMTERAQRNLVHHRGVGSQAAHPLEPFTRLKRGHEFAQSGLAR